MSSYANTSTAATARRSFKRRLTVRQGNLYQAWGLLSGVFLLYLAASIHGASSLRFGLMLAGFTTIYFNCHSIVHYLAGRAVGLRFRGYGIRGTDHPEVYPNGIRQLMSAMPFYVALSTKDSREQTGPIGKAIYYAAGESSTAICTLAAAFAAAATHTPGGSLLFMVMLVWNTIATIVTIRNPGGDYAKALKALRSR
jgi:hypothetical protein